MTPLVSIVIPTYNQKDIFLRECIESAIKQTYSNIEIVISDNHSTNNALDIIKEYALKDKRIRIVSPHTFLNISESFLYVFTQASGEFICYVSSDDILLPNCIETQLCKMIEDTNIIFSHGQALYFNKDNTSYENWEYYNGKEGRYFLNNEVSERLLTFSYICFGGILIRNTNWKSAIEFLNTNNISVNDFTDILLVFMLFRDGDVYFHNIVLAKIRMENELRNQKYAYVLRDISTIWNFVENDKILVTKFKNCGIDFKFYKNKYYVNLYKSILLEFFTKKINIVEFKTAVNNLKSFNINESFKLRFIKNVVLIFPNLSLYLYTLIKK